MNYLITTSGRKIPIQYAAVAFTGEFYCETLDTDFANAVAVFSDPEEIRKLSVEIDGEITKVYEGFRILGSVALNAQSEHIVVGLRK